MFLVTIDNLSRQGRPRLLHRRAMWNPTCRKPPVPALHSSIALRATFVPQPDTQQPATSATNAATSLAAWFTTPLGAYVLAWEQASLDALVADLFGYFAVQVGLPGIDCLRDSRIPWRCTAALEGHPAVVADAHELPFAAESLDLVLLPHLLETSGEPHQILREVERVLRPEGQLLVTGFNPISWWGVRRMFGQSSLPPWDAEFVSVPRMKDWLKLLNFDIQGGLFGCYRPPFESEQWLGRCGFLEAAGRRWWPIAGAAYIMQAKKRVAGMRLITPARQLARRQARLLVPAVRQGSMPVDRSGCMRNPARDTVINAYFASPAWPSDLPPAFGCGNASPRLDRSSLAPPAMPPTPTP